MRAIQTLSFSILAALSTLLSVGVAQDPDDRNGTTRNCSLLYAVDHTKPVNSTGTAEFHIGQEQDKPWFLSTTVNTTEPWGLFSPAYISVPENSSDDVCVYRFTAQNRSASGDGSMGGCTGVIPQPCYEALTKLPLLERKDGRAGGNNCSIDWNVREIDQACGSGWNMMVTRFSTRFTNNSCSLPHPPSVEVPTGHRTYPLPVFATPWPPLDVPFEELYDLYARQNTPWIVAAAFSDRPSVNKVVCIAPDDVQEGSRAPVGPWPTDEIDSKETNVPNSGSTKAGELVKIVSIVVGVVTATMF